VAGIRRAAIAEGAFQESHASVVERVNNKNPDTDLSFPGWFLFFFFFWVKWGVTKK
jgi:hypothetical protein